MAKQPWPGMYLYEVDIGLLVLSAFKTQQITYGYILKV